MMVVVSASEPDFYNIYRNGRNIIDRRGKTREQNKIEGVGTINLIVSAAIDGSLLEEVIADLMVNGLVVETISSDENGEVCFEDVVAGKYIVVVSQETFNDKQSDEIEVQPGDIINLELSLDATLV